MKVVRTAQIELYSSIQPLAQNIRFKTSFEDFGFKTKRNPSFGRAVFLPQ